LRAQGTSGRADARRGSLTAAALERECDGLTRRIDVLVRNRDAIVAHLAELRERADRSVAN
jgi:hypothetical protein